MNFIIPVAKTKALISFETDLRLYFRIMQFVGFLMMRLISRFMVA